jgi:hypothetical protein
MEKMDIEHVVSVDTVEHEKANLSTVYTGDHMTNVHHKSATERRLVLKAQVLIASLAALIYFVAYLVSARPSTFGSVDASDHCWILLTPASGSE